MTIYVRLTTHCTERDIGGMIAALEVNYGEQSRTEAQALLLARTWFEALKRFDPVTLHFAAQAHMRKSKHFPRLAELFALCEAERAGMADAVRKPRPNPCLEEARRWRPPTPEDRERVAQIAAHVLRRLGGTRAATHAAANR